MDNVEEIVSSPKEFETTAYETFAQYAPAQTPIDAVDDEAVSPTFDPQSAPLPVLVSLAVAILLILVFALRRRSTTSTKRSAILLTGSSDAGKTAIYSTLVFNRAFASRTSLQPNISQVSLPQTSEKQSRSLRLIDIPGHPRLRDQFTQFLDQAKAVVFVVDASTIARNGAAVAEHLHHILHTIMSLPPSTTPPPVLLLAHKCDLLSSSSSSASGAAVASSRVRTILERELEKRRASQAGGVGIGKLGEDEDVGTDMGGLDCTGPSGAFRLKDWEGGEVEVLGSYVTVASAAAEAVTKRDDEKVSDGGGGLGEFTQWLQDLP